jgi:hypothetical protein
VRLMQACIFSFYFFQVSIPLQVFNANWSISLTVLLVLACEGSELKGYMRKQANSKAVRKHMRNGGMNSFNFHPSPRMVRSFKRCLFFNYNFASTYKLI